jgi:hypothetical protein
VRLRASSDSSLESIHGYFLGLETTHYRARRLRRGGQVAECRCDFERRSERIPGRTHARRGHLCTEEYGGSGSLLRTRRRSGQVALGEAPTGSNLRSPLVNAQQEIEKAWRNAVAAVPKVDAAQLGDQAIELSLDVDLTLEVGRESPRDTQPIRSPAAGDIKAEGQH